MTTCPAHPAAEIAGACDRCGRFYCQPEALALDGKTYCGDCGGRDDVDWLGAWGRLQEGRRSGLAWFLLVLGLGLVGWGLALLVGAEDGWQIPLLGAGLLAFGVAAALFITAWRWAREALLGAALVVPLLAWLVSREAWTLATGAPGLLLALSAYTDVPTALFLRRPVARKALRKHYERQGSNPLAITASRLAFVSLVVPGLGLLSLMLGVVAWSRVDLAATPPVGNRSAAAGAVFFSLFTLAMWGATLAARAW